MTEPDDVAGLVFWIKADQIGGLSDGDPVSTWEDQSGNSFNVTGAGAARPIYKTNQINGLPIVRFDGADDFLNRGATASLEIGTYSIFALIEETSGALGRPVAYSAGADSTNFGRGYAMQINNATILGIKGSGDGSEEQVSGNRLGFDISYYDIHYDGIDQKVYERGTLLNTAIPDTLGISYTNATGLFIGKLDDGAGGLAYFNGDLGELFIYNNTVSASDRTALQTYLLNKWFPSTPGVLRTPFAYINSQGAGASGGAGGGAGNIASISADGLNIYIASFNSLNTPTLIKISTALDSDGSVVFAPGAGGRIGVECAKFNADHVWVAGEFDDTNTVEKSENAGSSFAVKDDGTFGTIRTIEIGPSDDNKIMIFDGDNGDLIQSIDGGTTWTTINAAVTPLVNSIARVGINPEEIVLGNQGAANNSINFSPNEGVDLEDYQTGVYPNADNTKVIVK